MNPGKTLWSICLTLPTILVLGASQAGAELTLSEDFEADEAVESLTVQITVGADGEDLQEPIALDLGLGFPFRLHPVGRADDETAPFGAVPQLTTASRTVTAGTDASFTFNLDGELGQDPLRTSSQLLAGVRVSDISRIGFAGQGATNWVLRAYDIRINGRPFAANDEVNAAISHIQETARNRLAELEPEITPIAEEADDLRALIEAGLATDEDRQRLEDIGEGLVPLVTEQNRLERQLRGSYPWFEETGFRSPWREGADINGIRITLLTYPHSGADTRNYVYFRTGGHKYLLGSPDNPLAPEHGPQVFSLDLVGAPLTAADLRGKALGMIAHGEPFGDAPDRWHPQRLMIEVDGSAVYDSDDNDVDRLSLEAIRIIPPAHLDEAGNCVENAPCARETFVWEAGRGAGLDLATGGVAELPEEDSPLYPDAEPGLVPDEAVDSLDGEMYAGFEDYCPPFAGEEFYGDDWYGGYGDDFGYWDDGYWEDGWGGGMDYWGDGMGGYGPGYGWGDLLADLLHDLLGLGDGDGIPGLDDIIDDAIEPDPVGEPLQITNVRLVADGADRLIRWEVTGDEGNVASYHVELLMFYPHRLDPIGGAVFEADLAAGADHALVDAGAFDDARADAGADLFIAYVLPLVSAQFHEPDPAIPEPMQPGPAQPLQLSDRTLRPTVFRGPQLGGGILMRDVDPAGEPPHSDSAAWTEGPLNSHIGFAFDSMGSSATNLVARPGPELESMTVSFDEIPILPPRWSLVTHAGFVGDLDTENVAHVEAECTVQHMFAPGVETDPPLNVSEVVETHAADPQPLRVLRIDIDTETHPDLGIAPPYRVRPSVGVDAPIFDMTSPPAFFGMRFIER